VQGLVLQIPSSRRTRVLLTLIARHQSSRMHRGAHRLGVRVHLSMWVEVRPGGVGLFIRSIKVTVECLDTTIHLFLSSFIASLKAF